MPFHLESDSDSDSDLLAFYLKSTWQKAEAPLTCHTVNKTMHIKLLHTKLNATVKLNTTIINEATASI